MTLVQLRDVLLKRQRRTVVTVFAAAFLTGLLVIALLPKEYEATATLFVGENRPIAAGGVGAELDEVLARSYVELLATATVARAVSEEVEPPVTAPELEEKVSFEALTGTRLIDINVLDRDPERAQLFANTYAETFVRTQQRAAADAAESQMTGLRDRIETLAQELDELDALGDPDVGRRETVATELAAARDALAAAQQNVALQGSNVSVATAAQAPTTPARPRTKLFALLAAVLAAALAATAGFLRNTFDKRLRGEEELVEIVDAPVLARIPLQGAGSHRDVAALEAFEFLRTNLRLSMHTRDGGLIAVTSSSAADGKTTVVAGIAKALGSAGERVVAVDCDLRRPRLASMFGVDGRTGVTNVLVGAHGPDDLLRSTDIPDLMVLPGGPIAPNPAALVTTPMFTQMLEDLREANEYVLVDTAPVAVVADASTVTTAADGVILVVDLERTRRDSLIEACAQLRRSNTPLIGVVLNRVRETDAQYGGYSYGYGIAPAGNGAHEPPLRRVLRRERRQSV